MNILSYHNIRVPSKSAHSLYTVQTSMDLSKLGEVFFYANRGDEKLDFKTLYGAPTADCPSFHLITTKIKHKGLAGLEKRIAVIKNVAALKDDKTIAYVTQPRPLKFFLFLKKLGFRIKVVLEAHSEAEKWDSSIFRGTDGIIFTSRSLQDRLTEKYSIPAGIPQEIFYHRIRKPISKNISPAKKNTSMETLDEKSLLPSLSKREEIPSLEKRVGSDSYRGEGRLVEDAFCIGYIGGHESWKGVDTIVDALRHLPENVTACFIGGESGGADQMRLISRAKEFGIEKRLRFKGFVPPESIQKESEKIDVFILPLLESGKGSLPMKLFDYMYSGKPIVASSQESIMEVLKDGTSALFFQPGSDKGLAEQIMTVMKNPSSGMELSLNAYKALKSYTVEKWLEDMKTFLESI